MNQMSTEPNPGDALPEVADGADQGETPGQQVEPNQSAAPREPADRERQLQEERDRYYDLFLRKSAEFDNYRKRTDRERRARADAAAFDLLADILPIVDDLERALKSESPDDPGGGFRAGVELIYRQMLELLKRRGASPIEAVGADFDPHLHQAVVTESSPGHRDGEVIEELRRGYVLGDQLLRPAMVKVARA